MTKPATPKIDSVWYDETDKHNWRVTGIYTNRHGTQIIRMQRKNSGIFARSFSLSDWETKGFVEVT